MPKLWCYGVKMKTLTIGQVAKQADVGVETVRFYERNGLIAEPPRRPSGYREYPPETVDHIRFIRRAKELGFTLQEIKELLSLRILPNTSCKDIRKRTKDKIEDIDKKLKTLNKMKRILKKLTETCEKSNPSSLDECPILGALDG